MTLTEFNLKKGNHFVAMQYYGLIMNRTFLILLTKEYLIGLKVNGLVSVQGGADPLTMLITYDMSIKSNVDNPYSYVKSKYLKKIEHLDIFGQEILNSNKSNFKIERKDIINVWHDKKKKWGMGYYPHDGKVYVKTLHKKWEFIILGSQSGKEIEEWIKNKI